MSALTGPPSTPRAPSITDVAARSGVSIQTVSRVVNGAPRVADATRQRVLAAISDLGYRPNPAARALATGRAGVVGVLSPSSALYGPASMTAALGLAAVEAGVHLAVEHVVELDGASVERGLARLVDQLVVGVVAVAPVQPVLDALSGARLAVPLVSVDGALGRGVVDVSVDQREGARLATEHLLGLGHRTVWHVRGPLAWNDAAAREQGWREALEAAGREVLPPLEGDWTAGSGYRAGQVLARIPEATAVFTANDPQALGVVRALAERGLRVPQDVSVVGFDDTPESAHFLPPLTTVRQDFSALGRTALEVVLRLVAQAQVQVAGATSGPEADVRHGEASVQLPALLVERASTAPPAHGAVTGS